MIGDTGDSDFTFEELSAVVRRERSSGSLSDVRSDLYPAMIRLLDKQSRECERQIGIDIGSLASAAANERRKKIHQSIKLVVELRMSKVASLAIRTAMGCVNSTEGLPKEEKQYYDIVLEASRAHWGNTERKKKSIVLMDLESVAKPASVPITTDVPAPEVSVKPIVAQTLKDMPMIPDDDVEMDVGDIDFPEDFAEFPESELVPEGESPKEDDAGTIADASAADDVPVVETEAVPPLETHGGEDICPTVPDVVINVSSDEGLVESDDDYDDNSLLTIHVTEDIPEFVGPTRDYRLRKDDVVRMPAGMATVLINRKMAVKLF